MFSTVVTKKKNFQPGKNAYLKLINDLLYKVQKPGQYLGIEYGHLIKGPYEQDLKTKKRFQDAQATLALIYPDLYELGMSNFGIKILYQVVNNHHDFLCDRAYAPMKDMEELLRKNDVPLWGWESFEPLNSFDLLGISLSYELSCTNVLNILELSKIEVLSSCRKDLFPLVFAGGPAVFNPEPMADFMDFFIIGDGEEAILEVLEIVRDFKLTTNLSKNQLLIKLAQLKGLYVPKFYEPDPNENYLPKLKNEYKGLLPEKIKKRTVNLTDLNQPVSSPVPYLASVQDRQVLESRRGCDRGCRFCQPGHVYLPIRERTPDDLVKLSAQALKNTGYDEYSLLSLSASDYTKLHEVAFKLNSIHCLQGISLSMPSQRADKFDMTIANELNTVRKSGITLAPEAGTERLRGVINKGLKEKEIKQAIENVYDSGFHHLKLYFMIGLPTETQEDLDGIINLLKWIYDLSRAKNKKPLNITCTISTFVPKAFTPFQWVSQNSQGEFQEKISYLKKRVKDLRLRTVKLNYTEPKIALLEAVFSRGDRRMSDLIYRAFKKGAKFDSWDEFLNVGLWHESAKEINLDLCHEAIKNRNPGEGYPWEVIDSGLLKEFLIKEYKKAIQTVETPACTENTCHGCGVCSGLNVVNLVSENKSKNNKFVKEITDSARKELMFSQQSFKVQLPTKTIQKVEIIHAKTGNLKFISHLDVQRLFERAMRRAGIRFSYTEGFNPRPKMQWLMPLPLYYESEFELMHLELTKNYVDSDLQVRLNEQFPLEFRVKSVKSVELTEKLAKIENIKVLYRALTFYSALWEKYICKLNSAIENFLLKEFLVVKVLKKKNKSDSERQFDVRSVVERLELVNKNPLELELVLLGNTRVELVIEQLIPQELKNNLKNNEWQSSWHLTKKEVYKGV